MAATNHEQVGRALDLLKTGVLPFIEREMKVLYKDQWLERAQYSVMEAQRRKIPVDWDVQSLLQIVRDQWRDVFEKRLGREDRTLVNELLETRNKWAHQNRISADDAERAYDSVERLLTSMSSLEADKARQEKLTLKRLNYEENERKTKGKMAEAPVPGKPKEGLKAWRHIAVPHENVQNGKYLTADFALDLWQVYVEGKKAGDDGDPVEFFRRTYLTAGLKDLLSNALHRLNGHGGDPVVELQTNFGGGKTHSMVSLYHFFGPKEVQDLPGTETLIAEAGISAPPKVNRAVIVGNKIDPSRPLVKKDGTQVNTLWGEIAYQIGGKEGYEMVRSADERAVNPGDALRELFNRFAPCLILIDEWIAYARLLHEQPDLKGGSFDTHFTFAQTLTEAARDSPKTLLVVSIPASSNEVGGTLGQEALNRLKHVVARVQTSWHPATTEESFEIVRRRLFQPITDLDGRDQVVAAFADLYRKNQSDFPVEASAAGYYKRLTSAYPIHPELFDRLYNDWSSLDRFQKTRGVLRFMSAAIHNLWTRNDQSLMILPGFVPLDAQAIQTELNKVLEPTWAPVRERDVDGPAALPLQVDGENATFGRYAAARRVARTIYLGSAPMLAAAHRGIDDRHIKLGCVQPGETAGTFGDALRRLGTQSAFLYTEGDRYWYSTQPNLNREAEERAQRIELELAQDEIRKRLKKFEAKEPLRILACPAKADVADDREVRLVILEPADAHSANQGNTEACRAALAILNDRGTGNREFKNTLVYLAADKTLADELLKGARQYLAWFQIVDEAQKGRLNLDSYNAKTAEERLKSSGLVVDRRITEAYCWLLNPIQVKDEAGAVSTSLDVHRLRGDDRITDRAWKKLVTLDAVLTKYGPVLLRQDMDKYTLWRDAEHVSVKVLAEDFARYLYLPRLRNPQVLLESIADGVVRTTWMHETFGYAESFDEVGHRYLGLHPPGRPAVMLSAQALVVKPEAVTGQQDAEQRAREPEKAGEREEGGDSHVPVPGGTRPVVAPDLKRRFHASIPVAADRLSRDVDVIAREIVMHLTGLLGSEVTISVEMEAKAADGFPDHIQRTVKENCGTLKIVNAHFEIN